MTQASSRSCPSSDKSMLFISSIINLVFRNSEQLYPMKDITCLQQFHGNEITILKGLTVSRVE